MVSRGALFTMILTGAVSGIVLAGECPYLDSTWRALPVARQRELVEQTPPGALDDGCLIAFIRRRVAVEAGKDAAEAIRGALAAACERNQGFNLALYAGIAVAMIPVADQASIKAVVDVWEKYNSRFHTLLDRLEQGGDYRAMDSLYQAYDNLGRCDLYDHLRRVNLKVLLGDPDEGTRLCCRIGRSDPGMLPVIHSQLENILENASPEQRRAALGIYEECAVSLPDPAARSAAIAWLANAYGRYGFDKEEYTIVTTRLAADSPVSGKLLLDIAQRRFSRKLFAESIESAQRAWNLLDDPRRKTQCAGVLTNAYLRMGRKDSAAVWLRKADLRDQHVKSGVAVLFQQAGLTALADSIIHTIPLSLTRDTLTIRGLIFAGRLAEAGGCVAALGGSPRDQSLWRMRTAVYRGDLPATTRVLDSIRLAPEWEYTPEFLQHRYAVNLIEGDSAAFSYWGRLCRTVFCGTVSGTIDSLPPAGSMVPAVAELYFTTLARQLLDNNEPVLAAKAIGGLPDSAAGPRVLYYRAIVEDRLGRHSEARQLFERLMIDYPQDVFSNKARMELQKTGGVKKG
jgi:tetratricopeptide (TPR) repeat protein